MKMWLFLCYIDNYQVPVSLLKRRTTFGKWVGNMLPLCCAKPAKRVQVHMENVKYISVGNTVKPRVLEG